MVERTVRDEPMWDQPEVHDVYRDWHRILASYDGDRMAVAEAWTQTPESMARYVRPDEMQQAFNFAWLLAPWSAAAFADVIRGTLAAVAPVGAAPTWVLSNHDVVRHPTRYGGGPVGLARGACRHAGDARAARIGVPLSGRGARPGAGRRGAGVPAGPDVVPHRHARPRRRPRADPVAWHPPAVRVQPRRDGHLAADARRLGRRSPSPRSARTPRRRGRSTAMRCGRGGGSRTPATTSSWSTRRSTVLELHRGPLTVVCNCGSRPVRLPAGEVVLASGPLDGGLLPPNTAAWLV